MRIFILEDDPGRIARFREWFDGHDITQIDSCLGADAFQPPYDVIFLDHDLGGRRLVEHEDSGYAFAKLIKDKVTKGSVVIHSFNPGGARNIHEVFRTGPVCIDSYIAPFMGAVFRSIIQGLTKSRVLR